jgi:hypothetical protein
MSATRSASSFSTLRESSSVPEASTTCAQWNPLPTSTPAQAFSSTTTTSVVLAYGLALGIPAGGSLCGELPSRISISGRELLCEDRGAIRHEPSLAAEVCKPSPVPVGIVQVTLLGDANKIGGEFNW